MPCLRCSLNMRKIWMDEKGFATTTNFIGKSVPTLTYWEDLDINYHHIAHINQSKSKKPNA